MASESFINFLAKLPADVLENTKITPNRVTIPTNKIDITEFYNIFNLQINNGISPSIEKVLYVGLLHNKNKYISCKDILNKYLVFDLD